MEDLGVVASFHGIICVELLMLHGFAAPWCHRVYVGYLK